MRRWLFWLALLLLWIGAPPPAGAAGDTPSETRRRLDQVEAFHARKQYAAMESLATAVRMDLEKEAHPDTVLLVEALYQIFQSRNFRRMLADTVGVSAGLRSLALLDAAPGAPDTLRMNVRVALGWLYSHTLRSQDAVAQYRPALALARRHSGWGGPATTVLYNLGMALVNMGQTDSALAVLDDALAEREKLKLPRDVLIGDIHAGIATVYEKQEKSGMAEEAYAAAIRAHEEQLGPDDPGMLNTLSRAAAFEFLRGNYSRSVDHNQHALRIALAQNPPNKVDLLIFRLALAQGLEQLGDVRGAHDSYEQVVPGLESWLGPSRPVVLAGWISLAGAASKLGDADGALKIYAHVREIFAADSSLSERLPLASATENMAMILSERAPSDSALALAVEAERIARSLPGSDPTIALAALCTQLVIHGRRGEWEAVDRVDADIQRELDRFAVRENNQSDDIWIDRSEVARLRGRPAEAVDDAVEGARAARKRLTWNVRALSDQQALMLANNISGPLDRLLQLAAGADTATVRRAWDELIRTRGLVGIEVSRRRQPPASADTSLVRAHADWVRALSTLAQQEVLLASSLHDAAAESVRAVLRADVDECERRLVRDASASRPEMDADRMGLDAILAALSPDRALVGFAGAPGAGGSRRLLAFVGTGGSRALRCLDLGRADSLEALIDAWKATLGEPDPARRSEAACRRAGVPVAKAIWDPIARATAGSGDLFLVPEAPVAGLPWGALPVGRSDYLVESPPVVHILAAERELVLRPEPPVDGGLLAVGGVDYDRTVPGPDATATQVAMALRAPTSECDSLALSRLEPLPGTAAEVIDVEAAWSRGPHATEPVTRLEGAAAGEAEFKRLAPGKRLLHIATHGLALEDCGPSSAGTRGVGGFGPIPRAPEKSGGGPKEKESSGPAASPSVKSGAPSPWLGRQVFLAFAGAARARHDAVDENEGLLTAQEVAALDLRGTEWVVLSACHSASGESWTRQGVLGMERAFHLAGARTVIASQWSVDDDSTREWMRALYEARAGGAANAGDAMAGAARAILRERRASGRPTHPFIWAAFTANGE